MIAQAIAYVNLNGTLICIFKEIAYRVKTWSKGATQVNRHSLKLHFCMFERS